MQWIFIIIGKPVPTYIVEECRQAMVGVEWRMMKQGIRWGADTRRTDSIKDTILTQPQMTIYLMQELGL